MTLQRTSLPLVVLFVALISYGVLPAQEQPKIFEFLRSAPSARAAAMGGAFVTVTDDASALYYNPATLNTVDSMQVAFSFQKQLLDINSGFATFAGSISGIGKVGAGIDFTSNGTFDRTDKLGRPLGEFSANDIAFTVGWGSELGEGFSAGIAGKVVSSTIDEYSSVALALDGGLLYVDTTRRLQIGLSVLNLGSQVSTYGLDHEALPTDMKIGISHQPKGLPLLLAITFNRLLDQPGSGFFSRFSSFSIGGEFKISNPLRLRVGFDNRIREDAAFSQRTGFSGFSAGFGVVVKGYRFDYALNQTIGSLHHISVSALF